MEKYAFKTTWRFEAPVEKVWDMLYQTSDWPNWWKGVLAVEEIEPADGNGLNGVSRYTWKSALPYKLRFDMRSTVVEKHRCMEGDAFGELEGHGKWVFTPEENNCVRVEYYWDVYTTRKWMNTWAFIAKPLFNWNHDVVMRWGAQGLATRLGVKLLQC